MSDKENKKIKLGQKTKEGYKYRARVDFSKDISTQIAKVIREKEVNEILKNKAEEFKKVVAKFPKKEKNLRYYYKFGTELLFLDSNLFKNVARYSAFRRITEELSEILPAIQDEKVVVKHLDFMYGIAHIDKNNLFEASWDQWYEIMKFKEIYKKPKLLRKVLKECKFMRSGPSLRDKIREIIKKNLG